jgi:hypothetical protein
LDNITERTGLIGEAWIDRFCALNRADYGFRHRNVFFAVKRDDRFVATGKLIIWRGLYDPEGYAWTLEGFVRRGDEISHSEYETAAAVARIWGGDDDETWETTDRFAMATSVASIGW